MIGECIVTRRPSLISTVLGSCVSATFFHHGSSIGAMFHAMYPTMAEGRSSDDKRLRPCLFADQAVQLIVDRLTFLGIPLDEIEVKLFGGSFTMRKDTPLCKLDQDLDVGSRNVDVATRTLEELGLVIRSGSTLGSKGRKLLFNTVTGEVAMSFVNSSRAPIARRPRARRG